MEQRQEQQQEQEQEQQGPYQLFVNSLRSSETKRVYTLFFQKYQDFMGTKDLFCGKDPRLIELKIIEFIGVLKERGLAFHAISNYVASITAFYKINDIVLNTTKIGKFLPEERKTKKDRAYSREEIHQLIDFVDERYRVIILVLASTGIRIGALSELRLRHLQKLDHHNIYKITIYENSAEEYYTFTTPECSSAIDSYLEMRRRYGENITSESLLIREQFDVRSRLKKQKQLKSYTLARRLIDLATRCGVRSKEVKVCHGFRKFFTTQLVNQKINPEIREMLLGHKIGLTSVYYKPTEDEMLAEYMKAVNSLTINEENRLKIKVELLEREKTNYEKLDAKIDAIQREFYENKVRTGFAGLTKEHLTDEYIEQKIQERRTSDKIRRERERQILEELENEESSK